MMEAFERQARYFYSRLPDDIVCLEIGTGTGILSAYLHTVLSSLPAVEASADSTTVSRKRAHMTAVDINPSAVEVATETFRRNHIRGQVVLSDLTDSVEQELEHKVHIMFFNHPYVPCPQEEFEAADMHARSYAGGRKGREVLDRLIPRIPKLLSDHQNAAFYVVVLHPGNDISELNQLMADQAGLSCAGIVVARREGIESLAIVRYTRQQLETSGDGDRLPQATPEELLRIIRQNEGTHRPVISNNPVTPKTEEEVSGSQACGALPVHPASHQQESKKGAVDEGENDNEDEDEDDEGMRSFWK